jgi:hypothetical protein
MDPLTAFSFAASILSVVSCACTAIILTREWNRRIEFAMELSDVHQHEIEVLQTVIQECREIAISATQVPSSINEAFGTCASREKNLLQILMHMNGASSTVTKTLRLSVQKKDLQRHYSMFRESVLLLRDLCSEYEQFQIIMIACTDFQLDCELSSNLWTWGILFSFQRHEVC